MVSLPDLDRTAVTSATGRYALAEVPAGPHHISIRFIGYEERTLHALVPRSGQLEIDVSLQPRPYRLATIAVSQVNEDQTAQIAAAVNPSAKSNGLTDFGPGQGPGPVGAKAGGIGGQRGRHGKLSHWSGKLCGD